MGVQEVAKVAVPVHVAEIVEMVVVAVAMALQEYSNG